MVQNNHQSEGLGNLVGRLGSIAARTLSTRVELLAIEWQEERWRLRQMLIWSIAVLLLGVMGILLLTAVIILLFPEGVRVYVAAALAVLYFCGAAGAWFGLKAGLKREPFAESIDQVKKDRLWLESLK
ncbi:MAG TPA: phage holin family protein [Verrucomicrobiae bacterium]|nr:phage holin family protein [Verrucomicrobiae bacterium]